MAALPNGIHVINLWSFLGKLQPIRWSLFHSLLPFRVIFDGYHYGAHMPSRVGPSSQSSDSAKVVACRGLEPSTPSKRDRRQSQLSMVSLSRNHLDLPSKPGRRLTAGLIAAGIAELENAGELALDFDR